MITLMALDDIRGWLALAHMDTDKLIPGSCTQDEARLRKMLYHISAAHKLIPGEAPLKSAHKPKCPPTNKS